MKVEVSTTKTVQGFSLQMIRTAAAIQVATRKSGDVVKQNAQTVLSAHGSHLPGTKTPSNPGNPPAMISGQLLDSVEAGPVIRKGFKTYTVAISPNTVYARIQELGGLSGRNLATLTPARPYMRPTAETSRMDIAMIFARELVGSLR